MKLLISVDMEGISGVVESNHVNSAHAEYQRFRQIMTDDTNAAIRGAINGGAIRVQVSDAHGSKTNILIEKLDFRARLNSGPTAPFAMMQGFDQGFDAAFFIGYHARMGAQNAILSHTISGMKIANIWLNDRLAGEFGLNAALCGSQNVPVILVSGDQAACAEAEGWSQGIEQVVVKQANSRHAADCLTVAAAQKLIEEKATLAVQHWIAENAPRPVQVASPVKIVIEFQNAAFADTAEGLPGAQRLDGRRIQVQAGDMPAAYRAMRAAIMLASA